MKAQVNITETNEKVLTKIEIIGKINRLDVSNKEKQVNLAIEIAGKCIEFLDEESLKAVTGLDKKF